MVADADGRRRTVERATELANQMLALAKVEQLRQQSDAPVLDWAGIVRALARYATPVGSVLTQSLVLGTIQTVISVSVNAMIALAAGSIARFLGTRPSWLLLQRWLMGTVLAGLAVKMALEAKRA